LQFGAYWIAAFAGDDSEEWTTVKSEGEKNRWLNYRVSME